jgi:DHA2 family methylenomycin A resistance protein-like MFS transporter
MLPLSLFRRPNFTPALVVGIGMNLSYYGMVFVLTLYLQRQLHFSALRAGVGFLPLTATFIGSNIASGVMAARGGVRTPILVGSVVAAAGFALLLVARESTPYWHLLPGFVLIPSGMGLAIPAVTTAILESVEKSSSGIASGVLNAGRQAGGAVGVAIFGALCGHTADRIVPGLHASAVTSVALLLLVGAIALRFLRNERPT